MAVLDGVPVIDLTDFIRAKEEHLLDNGEDWRLIFEQLKSTIVAQIRSACSEWGFFYIINHGIQHQEIDKFRQQNSFFFHELTTTEKDAIRRNEKNSRGYYDDELTKNKMDWKQGFDFGAQNGSLDGVGIDGFNQWPQGHESFKTVMSDYFHQMECLSNGLLSLIACSLNIEHDFFKNHFSGNHTSFLRLNYYPVAPDPTNTMAVHHHTDAGALTVLLQDDSVCSLQVQREGAWHLVPPVKDSFVINIGDMIQVWSNDMYKAPVHQVLANGNSERFSAPFFYNPSYASDIIPIDCNSTRLYKTLNWGEFRRKRFLGDYADVGEEVQISHYRI